MKLLGILILVIVAVIALLKLRGSTAPASKAVKRKPAAKTGTAGARSAPTDSPYRSVSISIGPNACDAVKALDGKRFLAEDVARLPMAGCASATCSCKFSHHDDRREFEGEKRALTGLSTELYHITGNPERRNGPGRRNDDMEEVIERGTYTQTAGIALTT